MATKQGDFLLLNYTLKVKESGETVETTFDAVAKDAHIHQEDAVYRPRFIILGEGWLPKGLEESLLGMEPGKSATIEVPPDKGYGQRDPAKMRLIPLRRFREKAGTDPIPGAQTEFDGRPAVVRAVGAGRVQVDYNHPLAGRTLVYDVSIERVLEDEKEKMLSIISRRIPEVGPEKFVLDKENSNATIEVPEEAFYLSGLQVAKKAIIGDLQKFFPDLDSISFRETFKNPVAKPPAPATTEPAPVTNEPAKTSEEKAPELEKASGTVRKKTSSQPRKTAPRASRKRPMAGSESQR
jgi:peptidylprolyl isomerase